MLTYMVADKPMKSLAAGMRRGICVEDAQVRYGVTGVGSLQAIAIALLRGPIATFLRRLRGRRLSSPQLSAVPAAITRMRESGLVAEWSVRRNLAASVQ